MAYALGAGRQSGGRHRKAIRIPAGDRPERRVLAELNCGGLIPHQQVLTAMQLLCEEVERRFAARQ